MTFNQLYIAKTSLNDCIMEKKLSLYVNEQYLYDKEKILAKYVILTLTTRDVLYDLKNCLYEAEKTICNICKFEVDYQRCL